MRTFTIHIPRRPWASTASTVAAARAVKEGFSWPAFFLSFVWALWHRLWLMAGALIAIELAAGFAANAVGLDVVTESAISLGIALIVGWVANDLLRERLEHHGLAMGGVVLADSGEEAVNRFFGEAPARDGFSPSSTRSAM